MGASSDIMWLMHCIGWVSDEIVFVNLFTFLNLSCDRHYLYGLFMISIIMITIIIIVTVVMFAILRAEKEWGDGIRGLALSAARFSLLRFSILTTIITIIIKTSSIINILNKPSTSPLSTIDIIIKITYDTPQAGRWTPTHKELEASDPNPLQGRS